MGSYRFDSTTGEPTVGEPSVSVPGVLGPARRMSFYWRYDSVPDVMETTSGFAVTGPAAYSGGGFTDKDNLQNGDDGTYGTATPARNAGQGTIFGGFNLAVPIGAVIDSVKLFYERKYDTDTSIGISRVKTRVDGVEGPDHDNTDQPLTEAVVEVDVTGDRGWTWQDLQDGVFEVIAEARRGDTDTAHTQSWDFVNAEVVYHLPAVILQAINATESVGFRIAVTPKGAGVVLRLVAGDGDSFDGISLILPDTDPRISFGLVQHAIDNLDINLYLNSILELSITGVSTGAVSGPFNDLQYGWLRSPGANHVCWFTQFAGDDGDDLSDIGNVLSTHKGPASTNENNWNATGGDGAVNERPLSETNYKQHTASSGVRQTYTLEAADEGDVDISGKTIVGYMPWVWAKRGSGDDGDLPALIHNNIVHPIVLTTTPKLFKRPVTSNSYPSHAAGIGMRSNEESADTFLFECGVVVAYEGPAEESILPYQLLAEGTVLDLVDDLRAEPSDSYEFCYRSSESETAAAWITVTALDQEGGQIQEQIAQFPLHGGAGRTRISAGIEVQVHLEVIGGPISVGLWHRLNVDQ